MGEMIGVNEYAERNGVDRSTVHYWITTGKLEGVVKVKSDNKYFCKDRYMIPADAKPQKRTWTSKKQPEPPKQQPKPKPKRKNYTEREKNLYIAKHCGTMTYRELADELELDVMEVRRRYDILHEKLGV